ncbi:DELTA-actitoxin-Aeq1c-like [Takifugu flavidus]|uniref:DELTA-actitoxin-Aeq1c n=1 Tax=Takifugu flavidus TaxID=433684 RepID=A0A5C6PU20_9TELE|nr:DELTA-actitoxin-Aeq1c-like [Takifugu flavidus]TWW82077.1 DELTA-actitoxin-Aeq1c [Takifugu flavidus]
MPETAESHLYSLTTNRNCVIEMTNLSQYFCLRCPKVYMESGFTHSPPQPTVRTTNTEVCSFTKDDNTACGAVGVLTYELFDMRSRHCNEIIAIMFSVPFDYNFYKNWLSVGVFEHTRACDDKLYDHMYKSKDFTNFARQEANGSGLTYKGKAVDVRACMSDEGRAIIKLEVYDRMG